MTKFGKKSPLYDALRAKTLNLGAPPGSAAAGTDADTVDGFHASSTPTVNTILPLDGSALFPDGVIPSGIMRDAEHTAIGDSSPHHAAVTLGGGSAAELSLAGQQLTLAAVLTPAEHTAIGDSSPHHAAVTAGDGIDLSGQQVAVDVTDIIDTDHGLTENANNIRVNLQASGGLDFYSGAIGVDVSDFAGAGLEDDGAQNLRIAAAAAGDGLQGGGGSALAVDVSDFAGDGLEDDGSENLRVDEDYAFTWTVEHTFQADIQLDADLDFVGAQSITTTAGNLTLAPAGDVVLNPTGNDVLPGSGYDINLGALTTCSDLKNNYSEIRLEVEGRTRDTGLTKLGVEFKRSPRRFPGRREEVPGRQVSQDALYDVEPGQTRVSQGEVRIGVDRLLEVVAGLQCVFFRELVQVM